MLQFLVHFSVKSRLKSEANIFSNFFGKSAIHSNHTLRVLSYFFLIHVGLSLNVEDVAHPELSKTLRIQRPLLVDICFRTHKALNLFK